MNELEKAVVLLEQMQTCLRYGQMPTDMMLAHLSQGEQFSTFAFLGESLKKMKRGVLFPTAWKESLRGMKQSGFQPCDLERLEQIGDILGGSDFESQIEALSLQLSLLRGHLQQATARREQLGKLYRTLGVLTGIGVSIFLI